MERKQSGKMRIRNEQMFVFEEAAVREYLDRAAEFLRAQQRSAVRGMSNDALRNLVRRAIERARPFGLTTEREVLGFALASLLLGADFLESPAHLWARQVLARKGWTAEQRARYLAETAVQLQERNSGGTQPCGN